jgi:fructosamine-3-kinase
MLHPAISRKVEQHVGTVRSVSPVGGGCISHASRIDTERGRFFLKWSDGQAGGTFEAEAAGLNALRAAKSGLVIPEPIDAANARADDSEPGFILLEWIEEGGRSVSSSSDLGAKLALMHRHTAERFGFAMDNYIGRLPQTNGWLNSWTDFFEKRRLRFQRDLAVRSGRWESGWDAHLDRLIARLPEILPEAPEPSIVHGDLWGGNVLVRSDGVPAIIDPAAHYAHREVDLAMSELFGGFETGFYEAYLSAWPTDPGYAERRDVYNLYHVINHLNHFGRSYAGQVAAILRRY